MGFTHPIIEIDYLKKNKKKLYLKIRINLLQNYTH